MMDLKRSPGCPEFMCTSMAKNIQNHFVKWAMLQLSIEANITSQYEQHLRAILNLPLGDTQLIAPSAMVNLLGEPGANGIAVYDGFEEITRMSGVHVHLYGKKYTKPFRKMGHVTIID